MAVATLDTTAYGKLLARALPRTIKTVAENERMIAELEKLDKREKLSPEEEALAELMTALIERFEEERYPLGHATPVEALRVFMEDRGLRPAGPDPDLRREQRCVRRAEREALDQQGSRAEARRFLPPSPCRCSSEFL